MIDVYFSSGERLEVYAEQGTLLADALREAGIFLEQPCGGRGACRGCAARCAGELSPREQCEAELPEGFRLLCRARVQGRCSVQLKEQSPPCVTALYSEYRGGVLSVAADLGSTTVEVSLLEDSRPIARCRTANLQRTIGADVVSRISACAQGQLGSLTGLLRASVHNAISALRSASGCRGARISARAACGNTVMLSLFAALDVSGLSFPGATFDPFGRELELDGEMWYLAPCIDRFIGGDLVAGLSAYLGGQSIHRQTELYLDLGTNGELALISDGAPLVCSTAAGPVFEGAGISCGSCAAPGAVTAVSYDGAEFTYETIDNAPADSLCGCGLISLASALLGCGLLDQSGRLETRNGEGERVFSLCGGVSLTQGDIRALQLGKAAVAAGARILEQHGGEFRDSFITGGLGSALDIQAARAVGIPKRGYTGTLHSAHSLALRGCELLLSERGRDAAEALAARCECVELADCPSFEELFIEEMDFSPC